MKLFRKLVIYCLCFAQVAMPPHVLAGNDDDINFLSRSQIYRASISLGNAQQIDCHEVKPDISGIYHLALDSSLYEQDLGFYLTYQNTILGNISFSNGDLTFNGFDKNSFSFNDKMDLTVLSLKAYQFFNNARVNAKDICIDVEKGKNTKKGVLQAEQDIIVKGFKDFKHGGHVRAGRFLFTEGDVFRSNPNSQTLIGVMHCAKGKDFVGQGRWVAAASLIQTKYTKLKRKYTFEGRYFLTDTQFDCTIDKGSSIEAFVVAYLQSKYSLNFCGDIYVPSLGNGKFPYSAFIEPDASGKILAPAVKKIAADIQKLQRDYLPDMGNLHGVLLQAKNLFHSGRIEAPSDSLIYKSRNLLFSGVSQSGFFEDCKTSIKAGQANCGGILKSFTSVDFDLENRLKITGLVAANNINVVFSETLSSAYFTASSKVIGALSIRNADETVMGGTHIGPSLFVDSKKFKQLSTGNTQVNDMFIHAWMAKIAGKNKTNRFEIDCGFSKTLSSVNFTASSKVIGALSIRNADETVMGGAHIGPSLFVDSKKFEQLPTGNTQVNDMFIHAWMAKIAGKNKTNRFEIDSPTCKITTTGRLKASEHGHIKAETYLNNLGKIASQNTIYAKLGRNYRLGNLKAAEWFTLEAQYHPPIMEILAGKHPSFIQSGGIHFIESTPVNLHGAYALPQLSFGIGITAPQINIGTPLSTQRDLILKTTRKGLNILDPISANRVFLKSASDLATYNVHFQQQAIVEAEGVYRNYGSFLSPNGTAEVKAAAIYNIYPKSIFEAANLSFEATRGNIENWGTIRGWKFLSGKAANNIINHPTILEGWGGIPPVIIPALMVGGTGIPYATDAGESRLLGLRFKAGNQIINDGSHISAWADVYLNGDRGIFHSTVARAYLAYSKTKKSGFLKHKKKKTEIWSNVASSPTIISTHGRIYNEAPQGQIVYIGALPVALDGHFDLARDGILNEQITLEDIKIVKSHKYWGASSSKMMLTSQYPIVTKFMNGGEINQRSLMGNITSVGAEIFAPIYRAKADVGKIIFTDAVQNHSLKVSIQSISPTICGVPVLSEGTLAQAIIGQTPLASLYNAGQDRNAVDQMMQGIQLVNAAFNHTSALNHAYQQGNLEQEMLSRFAEVGVTAIRTRTTRNWTTSKPSLLQVGVLNLTAGTAVELKGGAQAHVGYLFKLDTPTLVLSKSIEESLATHRSTSIVASYNFMTYTPSASFSDQSSWSRTRTHNNAFIKLYHPKGLIDLGNLQNLILDGGNIITPNIKGTVQNMLLQSYQDEVNSRHHGFSMNASASFANGEMANPTGGFGFSIGQADMRRVNQHSGIIATNGFGPDFKVQNLHVIDTQLDPFLTVTARNVRFDQLHDSKRSYSVQGSMMNLDLSSAGNFVTSFGQNLAVMGTGVAVAEAARAMGAGDLGSSLAGTIATIGVSSAINNTTGNTGPNSGLGVFNTLSYSHNGQKTGIVGLDVNFANLNQTLKEVGDLPQSLFGWQAPTSTIEIPPLPTSRPEPELGYRENRGEITVTSLPDLPLMAHKKEPRQEQAQAPRQEQEATWKTRSILELPLAAQNLIENAPQIEMVISSAPREKTILWDQRLETRLQLASERIEERNHRQYPFIARAIDKDRETSSIYHGAIEEANAIISDFNESWFNKIKAYTMMAVLPIHMMEERRSRFLFDVALPVANGVQDGYQIGVNYLNGQSISNETVDNLLYSCVMVGSLTGRGGGRFGKGIVKTAGKTLNFVGKAGKFFRNNLSGGEIPIYDSANRLVKFDPSRVAKLNFVPYVENPIKGHWQSAKYATLRQTGVWEDKTTVKGIFTPYLDVKPEGIVKNFKYDLKYRGNNDFDSKSEALRCQLSYGREQNQAGTYVLNAHGNKQGLLVGRMVSQNAQSPSTMSSFLQRKTWLKAKLLLKGHPWRPSIATTNFNLRDYDEMVKSPTVFGIERQIVGARSIRKIIKNDENYRKRQPVTILSCHGGGKEFLQDLSNGLGTLVAGPNDLLWTMPDGGIVVAPKKWWTFDPQINMKKKGMFIYYYPGKKN